MRSNRYRATLVIAGVTVIGAIIFFGLRIPHTTNEATRDAENLLGFSVPETATDIHTSNPRLHIQGRCASIEFLLPNDQWRDFFRRNDINPGEPTANPSGYTCDGSKITCDSDEDSDDFTKPLPPAYGGQQFEPDGSSQVSVGATPDCRPGTAKISWMSAAP